MSDHICTCDDCHAEPMDDHCKYADEVAALRADTERLADENGRWKAAYNDLVGRIPQHLLDDINRGAQPHRHELPDPQKDVLSAELDAPTNIAGKCPWCGAPRTWTGEGWFCGSTPPRGGSDGGKSPACQLICEAKNEEQTRIERKINALLDATPLDSDGRLYVRGCDLIAAIRQEDDDD